MSFASAVIRCSDRTRAQRRAPRRPDFQAQPPGGGIVRPTPAAAAFLVAASLTALAAHPTPVQQPIRVGVDLVHFAVVVTDRQGTPIGGLTAEDFEIKERGKVQQVKFFAEGDPEDAPPLRLGFLLDT